jgi:hypothetical protein
MFELLNLVPSFSSLQRSTAGLTCTRRARGREPVFRFFFLLQGAYIQEINQYLFYHTINTRQCTLVIFRPLLIEAMTGKKVWLDLFFIGTNYSD